MADPHPHLWISTLDRADRRLDVCACGASRYRCLICDHALHAHELQVCLRCMGQTRADLADLRALYGLLPVFLGRLGSNAPRDAPGGPSSDETALPGADTLVMLAPGSSGLAQIRGVPWRRGRDDSHELDEHPDDPPSVAYELGWHEDDWRRLRGEPAATGPATVDSATAYLMPRLGWAAGHHPEFDTFARDVHRILTRLRHATSTSDAPETGVPCIGEGADRCGATLIRRWTDTGLSDEWECPRCGRTYSEAQYRWAVADQAASLRGHTGNAYQIEAVLRADGYQITAATIRSWAARGYLHRHGRDAAGRTLYDPAEVLTVLTLERADYPESRAE